MTNKKKLLFCLMYLWLFIHGGMAQVGFNTDNSDPAASSILDVKSTDKGVLIPRMTVAERDDISNPATGLMIFQTDGFSGAYFYTGGAWVHLGTDVDWAIAGNDLSQSTSGTVAIGTDMPSAAKLHLKGTNAVEGANVVSFTETIITSGNFTGSSSNPISISAAIPADIATNATAISLDIRLGGDTGDGADGGIAFGFPVNVQVAVEGSQIAAGVTHTMPTPPSVCIGTYYTVTSTTPGGTPTNIDITALATGKTSLTLTAEDIGGSYRSNCGVSGAIVELTLKYSVPTFEPALQVDDGTIRSQDLAGGVGVAITNSTGDIEKATASANKMLTADGSGDLSFTDYTLGRFVVGTPWDIDSTALHVRFGKTFTMPSAAARYDSVGNITLLPAGSSSPIWIFSIVATNAVAGTRYYAHSDERIKKRLGLSDAMKDLATLNKIKITDYQAIDSLQLGNRIHKKLIAQELAQIYPEAVCYTRNFIPNIYRYGEVKDGWVKMKNKLKKGDRIKYYTYSNGKNFEQVAEVETVSAEGFKINATEKDIFVYGKEVDDFHKVDYDALITLNISANQALKQKLSELEKSYQSLSDLLEERTKAEATLQRIEDLLNATTAKLK